MALQLYETEKGTKARQSTFSMFTCIQVVLNLTFNIDLPDTVVYLKEFESETTAVVQTLIC